MRNLILTLLLISTQVFATVANRVPDLLVRPGTTAARPSGEAGQVYDNSTLSAYQFYLGGGWQTAATNSNTLTFTNKSIDCSTNTCTNVPATTLTITNDNATNATMYPLWFTGTSGALTPYVSSTKMSFNPSTGMLTTTGVTSTFTGNLTGTATNATNTGITDDTTTNATMYPTWATAATGNLPQKVSSSKMSFNPSTGMLTVTGVTSTVTGNASTATALAADPADCGANQFATAIAASGAFTCAQPSFSNISSAAATTQGGTGLTTYTLGDTLYASAANTLAKLAGNITTSMKAFTQTGDGANSAAPVWTTVTSTNTASSIMARDSSGDFTSRNATLNTANLGYRTTATAAGTTTLTVADTQQQFFSGASTQTVVLPVVTTLVNGQIYRIVNLSTGSVTVQSSGANTIQVMTTQTELVVTVRDSTAGTGTTSWTARYNSLAGAAGGGGGSLQWIEASGNSPIADVENFNRIYKFQSGLGQLLYTTVRVPTSYVAGNQVNLKLTYYSPDSSNTGLLTCVSTLIRTGTDAITSTTNQRTSTNGAVTFASANRLLSLTCDLSSSTGQINSTAISAGDLILVSLTRGADSATSDIRALVYGAEVTFQ